MSAFLKALAWVAPRAAIERAYALSVLDAGRAYDGAIAGRRGAGFTGRNESANAALGMTLARLRDRSSDLVRNTWIGARCMDVLTAHVWGAGITVAFAEPRAQDAWDEWCRHADIEGERDFNATGALALRAMFERGDSVVRMLPRRLYGGRRVPLALHVAEGDLIDESRDGMIEGQRARLGVALGEWEERLGYWMHAAHPSEQTFSGGARLSQFAPRSEVCHLYRALRPGQVRGVPLLAPVLLTVRDWHDLLDAMIVKSRMEACYGLAISSGNPAVSVAAAKLRQDDAGKIEEMRPGMIYRGEPGDTITTISPSGSGQFEPVSLAALMGIASGGMLTYDQLTGDLRQANYSSLRAGKIEFWQLVEQLQWLVAVPLLMNRVVGRWLEIAQLSSVLRERQEPYRYDYVMPARTPIDPLKDLKADILAVRAGRMSPQEFIGAWGRDWRQVIAEVKEFWSEADAGGLVFDIDPRRTTQSGAAQADPQEEASDARPSDS